MIRHGKSIREMAARWFRLGRGYFPLTALGSALSALISLTFLFAARHLDLVLLTATVTAVIVLIILTALTTISALILNRGARRASPPALLEIETGSRQLTGFTVRFPRWIPLINCDWQTDPADFRAEVQARAGNLEESVQPVRRGIFNSIDRRFRAGDIFGLTQISWTRRHAAEITVLPAGRPLNPIESLFGFAAGDEDAHPDGEPRGDRVEMRPYVPGDPIRMILWKVYARSGKLMVRVPERAVAPRPGACAYFIAGPGDEAAAGVARTFIERRLPGESWCFGADGSPGATSDPQNAITRLARSGSAPVSAGSIASFLLAAEKQGYAHCLIFVPSARGPWMDRAGVVLAKSGLKIQVVTAVESVDPDEKGTQRWRHILFRMPPHPGASMPAIERLRGHLRLLAHNVLIVDAASGLFR